MLGSSQFSVMGALQSLIWQSDSHCARPISEVGIMYDYTDSQNIQKTCICPKKNMNIVCQKKIKIIIFKFF